MSNQLAEYQADLEELNQLFALAKRKKVITLLNNEITSLKARIMEVGGRFFFFFFFFLIFDFFFDFPIFLTREKK